MIPDMYGRKLKELDDKFIFGFVNDIDDEFAEAFVDNDVEKIKEIQARHPAGIKRNPCGITWNRR